MKKYVAWKEDKDGNYISEDRIFTAPSINYVFSTLASEEGVKYDNNRVLLRLPNGDIWFVKLLTK